MTAEREAPVGEHGRGVGVVGVGPFEIDEDQGGADRGAPLVDRLHRRRYLGITGVLGETQRRVVPGSADERGEVGERGHHLDEIVGIEGRDRAVMRPQLLSDALGLIEQDHWTVGAVEQRIEVPSDVGGEEIGVGRSHADRMPAEWPSRLGGRAAR